MAPSTVVRCRTTQGVLDIGIRSEWAPLGAARFLELVDARLYDQAVIYRCAKNFVLQFDINPSHANGDGEGLLQHWMAPEKRLEDERQWLDVDGTNRGGGDGGGGRGGAPPGDVFARGLLSFAGSGPRSRQFTPFIALRRSGLGKSPWEIPFGQVTPETDHVLDKLNRCPYGDLPVFGGSGPEPPLIYEGLDKVLARAPGIDYIHGCRRA